MKTFIEGVDGSLRASDLSFSGAVVGSRFYIRAMKEVESGEATIEAYIEPVPTVEEKFGLIQLAVLRHVDEQAIELKYFGMNSIAKYLGYDNPWRAECEKLAAWNVSVWESVVQIESDFENGNIEEPTLEYVLSQLPEYV